MSGHSKWSQIKRQKGSADAKKSQTFGKLGKNIALAAKKGADPSMNPELRTAIEKAKQLNMPNDTIDRAIKKGASKLEADQLESVRYEAYGPGGVAIIMEGITDSKNRTNQEIKHMLVKNNAKWAEIGSVIWAFEHKDGKWESKIPVEINEQDAQSLDKLLELLDDHEDIQEVYTNAS